MEGIYLVYFIGKYEKTFRDLGSGFVVKQKGFFYDQRGEGET